MILINHRERYVSIFYRFSVPPSTVQEKEIFTMPKYIEVTAAIMEKKGKILIAKRKVGSHLAGKWEFPGGKVEPGESPQECLQRELQEELAIHVQVEKFIGVNIHHYSHLSIMLLAYHVLWKAGDFRVKAHDCIKWVSIARLDEYDFAPADVPFVEKLKTGEIELR
jgi:8-oxo-dGTP diphosphatase